MSCHKEGRSNSTHQALGSLGFLHVPETNPFFTSAPGRLEAVQQEDHALHREACLASAETHFFPSKTRGFQL